MDLSTDSIDTLPPLQREWALQTCWVGRNDTPPPQRIQPTAPFNWNALPVELRLVVASNLDARTLAALATTSRTNLAVCTAQLDSDANRLLGTRPAPEPAEKTDGQWRVHQKDFRRRIALLHRRFFDCFETYYEAKQYEHPVASSKIFNSTFLASRYCIRSGLLTGDSHLVREGMNSLRLVDIPVLPYLWDEMVYLSTHRPANTSLVLQYTQETVPSGITWIVLERLHAAGGVSEVLVLLLSSRLTLTEDMFAAHLCQFSVQDYTLDDDSDFEYTDQLL